MTPNYVDNSFSNWTISPWCTCEGSGNQEEECYNFLRFFTENTCLSESPLSIGVLLTAFPFNGLLDGENNGICLGSPYCKFHF